MNDGHLLQAWATERSEAAFAEIVHRHLNLVYASALRQVRDVELARDVAQAVFLILARKAGRLGPKVLLAGWLFRTTRFVAARALRTAQRRQHYEQLAVAMNPPYDASSVMPEHWLEVEPHLDAALVSLSTADRDALVLRYFERHPLRTVADRLGISEDAAKKRVVRAVEKLRVALGKRSVPLTSVSVAALLARLPSSAAPADCAAGIASAATGGTSVPGVVALADAAPRDWFLAAARGWVPGAAATLLLIVGAAIWWDSQSPAAFEALPVVGPSASQPIEPMSRQPIAVLPSAPAQPGPASIMLLVCSAEDNQPLFAQVRVNFRRAQDEPVRLELVTSAQGTVAIPINDRDISSVIVWASAPGYVPVSLQWRGHEFVEPILLHTARLQRGGVLTGVVQDEEGNPVPDAEVQFHGPGIDTGERANVSFHPRLATVKTDGGGRFRTGQIPSSLSNMNPMSYTVEHPEYVRERVWLRNSEATATNHHVVLTRGLHVRGRVITSEHQPLSGAKVREAHHFAGPQRESITDQDGSFSIGPFAPGTVPLQASADGFQAGARQVPVAADATNIVLQLALDTGELSDWQLGMDAGQTVRLTGTVVDVENGEALPSFQVRLNEHRGTALEFLGDGHHGRFDWPVFMAFYHQFSLRIDAVGYEPAETDLRPVQAGTQEFVVRLRRTGNLAGLVVTLAGQPVEGAYVGLNGDGYGHAVTHGRPWSGNDAPQTTTDAAGRFAFKPQLGAESVLVVHELGCTLAPISSFTNQPIVLQPWGAIEGTLLVGQRVAAEQAVALEMDIPQEDQWISTINIQGKTTSDAQGRFRFNSVPAGIVRVARYFNFNRDGSGPVGFSHYQRVVVPAGGVAEVVLGGTGRMLVGRLALSHPLAGHNWRDDLQSLVEVSSSPEPRFDGLPGDPGWRALHRLMAWHRANQRRYYLEIAPDGAFQIADVMPGEYLLELQVTEPPDPTRWDPAGNPSFQRPLGKVSPRVTIPDGPDTQPVDLGTFTIPWEKRQRF